VPVNDLERELPEIDSVTRMQEIQDSLRRLERRDWWLWWTAVFVMLLLTLAVVSLSLPTIFRESNGYSQLNLSLAVHGLVGLVLLFNVYTIYQQVLIKRLRQQMAQHVEQMTSLKVRAEEFHKLATLDPLTGLYNRRLAEQRLTGEVSRSQRYGHPLTVLVIDLNGFKQINDRYGHAAGDLVLKLFAERLNRAIRASDLAVRMGGDEFMVLLPECQPEQVQTLLLRLNPMAVEFRGETIPVTYAAGWAGYRPGETAEQILERADQALYADKRAKKPAYSIPTAR
jgi:diguanylate cyclase (GGDEF)-like protein